MHHVLNDDPSGRIRIEALQTLAVGGAVPWSEPLGDVIHSMVETIPMEAQDDPVLTAAMAVAERGRDLTNDWPRFACPRSNSQPFGTEWITTARSSRSKPDNRPTGPRQSGRQTAQSRDRHSGQSQEIGRKATLLGTTTRAMRGCAPQMREVLHWIPVVDPHRGPNSSSPHRISPATMSMSAPIRATGPR